MVMPSLDWFVADRGQMQALNPIMVMILIPFNNLVLYPMLRRFGYEPTALRRMGRHRVQRGGVDRRGGIQVAMDAGDPMSIVWQVLPYALLTFGEVLVSATGLEFAYSQAPQAMKGVIMSFWYLTTTIGNLWVLLANAPMRNDTVTGSIATTGLERDRVPDVLLRRSFAITVLVWRRRALMERIRAGGTRAVYGRCTG
jgi:POT family proton-dependent oligopeptide transporter